MTGRGGRPRPRAPSLEAAQLPAVLDAIPAGSIYKPGSIRLEGAALTDIADADAGEISPSGVAVRLGTVPAGQARTVTFQVTIAN